MTYDLIVTGTGGQGVLTTASVILTAALQEGYNVRQSEVHGMAQRGGAVTAQVRISDTEIFSDLISRGAADLIVGTELLETLRCLPWLSKNGTVVTAATMVRNIPEYPDVKTLNKQLAGIRHGILVDTPSTDNKTTVSHSENMFLLGIASRLFSFISYTTCLHAIDTIFSKKNQASVILNKEKFEQGWKLHLQPGTLAGKNLEN